VVDPEGVISMLPAMNQKKKGGVSKREIRGKQKEETILQGQCKMGVKGLTKRVVGGDSPSAHIVRHVSA